jgi:hypothetical protein
MEEREAGAEEEGIGGGVVWGGSEGNVCVYIGSKAREKGRSKEVGENLMQ